MTSSKRYFTIDILKFILAVFIILHHFQQTTSIGTETFRFYGGAINFGYCVDFFFIISGFVSAIRLTSISEVSLSDYMIGKIKRLYPAAALSVTCMIIINVVNYLFSGHWYNGLVPDIYKVLNSYLMTFSGGAVECGRGINNPLWYICVLMICYVLLWLIMDISRKKNINHLYLALLMCIIGLIINTYSLDFAFLNENTSRGYCGFFLGVILNYVYSATDKKKMFLSSLFVLILCTSLALFDYNSFYHYEWQSLIFVLFPSILFVILYLDRYLKRSLKIFSWLPFQMYVWHSMFIMLFNILSRTSSFSFLLETDGSLMMLLFVVIIIVFSLIYHMFIEERFDKAISGLVRSFLVNKGE